MVNGMPLCSWNSDFWWDAKEKGTVLPFFWLSCAGWPGCQVIPDFDAISLLHDIVGRISQDSITLPKSPCNGLLQPSPPFTLGSHWCVCHHDTFVFFKMSYQWKHVNIMFGDFVFHSTLMSLWLIHVVIFTNKALFFVAEKYSLVWASHSLYICPLKGTVFSFQLLQINWLWTFTWSILTWIFAFSFLGCILEVEWLGQIRGVWL